ncbi:hypothetical protein A4G18_00605 [Pasteurellaceae bacterium Pebbles2]|nr:hypothetical protein [Pasteurellaceae bacterium Pebbles2]
MITFGYDCPYCAKKDVAFTIRHIASNVADTGKYRGQTVHNVFATCNHCFSGITAMYILNNSDDYINGMPSANGLIAAVNDKLVHFFDDVFDKKLAWFPEPPISVAPQYLPVDVERKFLAGEKIYFQTKHDENLVEFAGTAYRSALEQALKYLDDNSDKNLNRRINHLVKTQVLVKSMGDFAHTIRSLGNEATHNEISADELDKLRLFTQLFLQYAFTLPAMISNKP